MRAGPPPPPYSSPSPTPVNASPSQAGQRTGSSSAVHIPSWAYQAATVLSLLVGITSVVRGTRAIVTIQDSDLTNFFLKSAEYVLQGNPFHMYAVHGSGVTSSYPNYNPPLSILLLAPLYGLAQALGLNSSYGQVITFVTVPFVFLVPLLGYLTLRVLRSLYPEAPETLRFLAFLLVTLSPLTWQTYGIWYHVEQPVMLCFLLGSLWALQARRDGLAGALAGLAFLSRTTALIPLIAVGVMLLTEKQWRSLLTFGGVSAAVAAVGLGPFFLFDPHDTIHSLVTWRGTAPIGGNSIWTIFSTSNTVGLRHTLDSIARRLDMYTVILVVAIVAYFAVRRLRISAYSRDAWAIVAIATLTVPMLSKTNWPYYFLEPFFFILIWEFASMHDRLPGVWRWPVLTIGYLTITATLSQYIGLQSVGALDRVSVGVLNFVAMVIVAGAIWLRIPARKASAGLAQATRSPGSVGRTEPSYAAGYSGVGAMGAPSGRMPASQTPQSPSARLQGPSPWQEDAHAYASFDAGEATLFRDAPSASFGSGPGPNTQQPNSGRWRLAPDASGGPGAYGQLQPTPGTSGNSGQVAPYRDDNTPRRGNLQAPTRDYYPAAGSPNAPGVPPPANSPSTPLWPSDPNGPSWQNDRSSQTTGGLWPDDASNTGNTGNTGNSGRRGAAYPGGPGSSGAGRRPRMPGGPGVNGMGR